MNHPFVCLLRSWERRAVPLQPVCVPVCNTLNLNTNEKFVNPHSPFPENLLPSLTARIPGSHMNLSRILSGSRPVRRDQRAQKTIRHPRFAGMPCPGSVSPTLEMTISHIQEIRTIILISQHYNKQHFHFYMGKYHILMSCCIAREDPALPHNVTYCRAMNKINNHTFYPHIIHTAIWGFQKPRQPNE